MRHKKDKFNKFQIKMGTSQYDISCKSIMRLEKINWTDSKLKWAQFPIWYDRLTPARGVDLTAFLKSSAEISAREAWTWRWWGKGWQYNTNTLTQIIACNVLFALWWKLYGWLQLGMPRQLNSGTPLEKMRVKVKLIETESKTRAHHWKWKNMNMNIKVTNKKEIQQGNLLT